MDTKCPILSSIAMVRSSSDSAIRWHARLGHPSLQEMQLGVLFLSLVLTYNVNVVNFQSMFGLAFQ